MSSYGLCGICGEAIDPGQEPHGIPEAIVQQGVDVPVHSDCYFDELSDQIDDHPIGRSTPRGGCHGID